ncbi:glycoside hydrolase family 18 protein (plasmid) [Tistrella mobilis]|uniref:hypothetical protein n=1 Tax=Tistrella mobilis TaxID=171437 RepID=UPI00355863A7
MAVTVVSTLTLALGGLSGSSTHSLDATGADLIVALVPIAYYDDVEAGTPWDHIPAISYAGLPLTPVHSDPLVTEVDYGTVVLYVLPSPPAGAHDLVISTTYWMGYISPVVWALAGTSGRLSPLAVSVAEVAGGDVLATSAVHAPGGGLVLGAAASYWFTGSPDIPAPAGWTATGAATGAYERVFAFARSAPPEGGDISLEVTQSDWGTALALAAVAVEPYGLARDEVLITAAEVYYAGQIDQTQAGGVFNPGSGSGSTPAPPAIIDTTGADLLLVGVLYTHTDPAPTLTYAGRILRYLDDPAPAVPEAGKVRIAYLATPPAGSHELLAAAWDRFVGIVVLHALAISGCSGAAGIRLAATSMDNPTRIRVPYTHRSSRVLAISATPWGGAAELAAAGWTAEASAQGDYAGGWIWSRPGGGCAPLVIDRSVAYATQLIAVIEIEAGWPSADIDGTGDLALLAVRVNHLRAERYRPRPDGQPLAVYWESWMDQPASTAVADLDAMHLMALPAEVDHLYIHTALPLCTYTSLADNLKATVGIQWDVPVSTLKAVVDRFRASHPRTRIQLVVMQLGPSYEWLHEPYDPAGWGGQTDAHMAALRHLVDDLGLDGIEIDYEVLSEVDDLAHHCWTDPDGIRRCYTDAELLAVIKRFRAWFPRPYLISWAGLHVGCYGEAPYAKAAPAGGGWNGGYALAVARDPEASAALDHINIMTYDAGREFDPVEAYQAYRHWFPSTRLLIGLRVGPPEWGFEPPHADTGARRSLADFRGYLNHVSGDPRGGAFVYAWNWDWYAPSAAAYSATGVYDDAYPDGAMAVAAAIEALDRGYVPPSHPRTTVDRVVTIELRPRDLTAEALAQTLLAPWAAQAWATLPSADERRDDGLATLRYADKPMTTGADDLPAHSWWDGRATSPLSIERGIPIAPEATDRTSVELGRVELANADGGLDEVPARFDIGGRQVIVRALHRDLPGWRHSASALLVDGLGTAWEADRQTLTLTVEGQAGWADRPLQSRLYAGTGGAEGGEDLAGKPMPVLFGRVRNVEPVLIDPMGIYQLHHRAMRGVLAVRDKGFAIDPAGVDCPNFDDLKAATVPAGTYATCLAGGYLRLGTYPPAGVVTCDADGDAVGGWAATTADVLLRLLVDHAAVDLSRIGLDAVAALAVAVPGVIGWYQGTETATVGEVIDRVTRAAAAWWGSDGRGVVEVGRLALPRVTPDYALDQTIILETPERLDLPDSIAQPSWRRRVGWRRNWRVQGAADLPEAPVEPAVPREFLSEQWRVATAVDTSLLADRLRAIDADIIETAYDAQADAQALADHLLSLYGRPALALSITVPPLLAEEVVDGVPTLRRAVRIGSTIRVTYPRYGLSAGRNLVLVGVSEDWAAGRWVLTLWGPS